MKSSLKKPESILEDFFQSVQQYIHTLLNEDKNLIKGVSDFVTNAWEIPKEYKGQSGQMGFIPEYLIFETVKQYIEKKKKLTFLPLLRTTTFEGLVETNYFVDAKDNPTHLLCQGLRPINPRSIPLELPNLDRAHDVTYLIKKNGWLVKAIFEVKSYFETPSLEGDLNRLRHAEMKYPLSDNYALVFVGLKKQAWLAKKERELISKFTKENHHFCILPGENDPSLGNSQLEAILNFLG